jgi:hypothetical protein
MTPHLTAALRQLRDELAGVLEPLALQELCRSLGLRWRERALDPVTTIHLFLLQVLNGNTACAHLPRLTGLGFTASAYCQARARLPLPALQALLRRITGVLQPLTDTVGAWRGHRTWFIDGTGVSLPDTPPLQAAFGQPTNQAPGCGFPVARVLALFHAGTGLLQSFLTAPLRSHEMARVALLHPELRAGDVLVGDRAFGTFAHLALLVHRGLHGVFRMSQRRVVDFTPGRPAPPRWNTRKLTGKARSRWVRALVAPRFRQRRRHRRLVLPQARREAHEFPDPRPRRGGQPVGQWPHHRPPDRPPAAPSICRRAGPRSAHSGRRRRRWRLPRRAA